MATTVVPGRGLSVTCLDRVSGSRGIDVTCGEHDPVAELTDAGVGAP